MYRQALSGVLAQVGDAERAAVAVQTQAVGRLRIRRRPTAGRHRWRP